MWSSEKEKLIADNFRAGFEAEYSARILQVSRRAVLGKLWRMGLVRGTRGKEETRRAAARRAQRSDKPKANSGIGRAREDGPMMADQTILQSMAWDPIIGSKPVTLEFRTGCAWPVGDKPMLFCNLEVEGESCYCSEHKLMAYRRPTEFEAKLLKPKALANVG